MFDIGAIELLVVAIITILVVGPRDLPGVLRNFARAVGKARRMANDFQRQFNQALTEAERETGLEETRKQIRAATEIEPRKYIGTKMAPSSPAKGVDTASTSNPAGLTTTSPGPEPASKVVASATEPEASPEVSPEASDDDAASNRTVS